MSIQQKSSSNYGLFHINPVNRAVVGEHGFEPRPDLLSSMRKHGFRKVNPIVVVPREGGGFLIIDGHNRFVTAQYLGLPIEYIMYAKEDAVSPLEYSLGQKAWSIRDVVNGYAKAGLPDYAEVVEYSEYSGIPIGIAIALHNGHFASTGISYEVGAVKSGAFRVRDRETPRRVASLFLQVRVAVPKAVCVNLLRALDKCLRAEGV